ncbi:pilus retraction ATPase PilT [Kushneria sinocarnis]|uniref:Pilus retraction ATPase PilT n=1 Tax=Kushneria sinocarnis TaxID=595502 RepID=A0A420WST8_9GAMM|nr:type IV pilus twitching motility protein PilT [Kushneria sinocarnis]RKQ95823.1 pilus retraction ATPase PilT [Kushneria sinocarnis]
MDITELLAFSAKQKASDLHLSAGLPPMIRVDGDIRRLNVPPLEDQAVRTLLHAVMNEQQQRDYAAELETDFSIDLPGVSRFRVNVFTQQHGAAGVFRTIPATVPGLDELGLGEVFRQLASLRHGLVLVTGPTGSGKSTTLAAMLDYINRHRHEHILTIEDPIEFVHTARRCLINQREAGRHTHGVAAALRSALREDPDIILVGELRDPETIRLALTAAETGHVVFATLHTTSAAKTVDRIIDVFPGDEKSMVRSMLSESLQGVISQTLLKRIGGGRIAAHEVLVATPAIRNLIREDKVAQIYSALQTGAGAGMQTMEAALDRLATEGLIVHGGHAPG